VLWGGEWWVGESEAGELDVRRGRGPRGCRAGHGERQEAQDCEEARVAGLDYIEMLESFNGRFTALGYVGPVGRGRWLVR